MFRSVSTSNFDGEEEGQAYQISPLPDLQFQIIETNRRPSKLFDDGNQFDLTGGQVQRSLPLPPIRTKNDEEKNQRNDENLQRNEPRRLFRSD